MKADFMLDIRGKGCPMPVVLTVRKLEEMKSGQILEVIGDYPPSKENIHARVTSDGHEVLDVINERDSFRIFIKKK